MEGFEGKCLTGTGDGDDFGLPELSGLQYLAVGVLFEGEMTSDELLAELFLRVGPRSRASFCRLMKRLLKASIVDITHRADTSVNRTGQEYAKRQHSYQVTDLGVILWKKARDFYVGLKPPPDDFEAVKVLGAKFAEYGPQQRREMELDLFAAAFGKMLDLE